MGWWVRAKERCSDAGGRDGSAHGGTSAALLAIAMGHRVEENVSGPSPCSWAGGRWGAGRAALAGVGAGGGRGGVSREQLWQLHAAQKAARGSCLPPVSVSREGVNLISVPGSISIRGEYCICIHSPLSPLDDRVPPSVVCFSAGKRLPINSPAAVDNAIVSLRCL